MSYWKKASLDLSKLKLFYSLLLRNMTNWRTYFSWWRVVLQDFLQVLNQEFFDIFALWLVWLFLIWRRMLWWSLACLFLFQYLVMFTFLLVCLLLDFVHFCLLFYYIESVSCAHDVPVMIMFKKYCLVHVCCSLCQSGLFIFVKTIIWQIY